jgi:hypothetical protein
MALQRDSLALRIGTADLGDDRTFLYVLLAADAGQNYHGLLSEARRTFLHPLKTRRGPTGFAVSR